MPLNKETKPNQKQKHRNMKIRWVVEKKKKKKKKEKREEKRKKNS